MHNYFASGAYISKCRKAMITSSLTSYQNAVCTQVYMAILERLLRESKREKIEATLSKACPFVADEEII